MYSWTKGMGMREGREVGNRREREGERRGKRERGRKKGE